MRTEQIKTKIEDEIKGAFVVVESADDVHFYATVVSAEFEGVSKIKQHKRVLDLFQAQISAEEIHAFSIKTYTPDKWAILSGD